MMGAFGSAAVSVFGIIWTISAMSMGAPSFFALFGLIFVAMGIAQTVYNLKKRHIEEPVLRHSILLTKMRSRIH